MKVIKSIASLVLFVSCLSLSMEKNVPTSQTLSNPIGIITVSADLSAKLESISLNSKNQFNHFGTINIDSTANAHLSHSNANTNPASVNLMHANTGSYQTSNSTISQQHRTSSSQGSVIRLQKSTDEQSFKAYNEAERPLYERQKIYYPDMPIQTLETPYAQASETDVALTTHAQPPSEQPPVQKQKYITAPQDVMRAYNTSKMHEDRSPAVQMNPALYANIIAKQREHLNKNPRYIATIESRDFLISVIDNLAIGNYITVDEQLRNYELNSAVPKHIADTYKTIVNRFKLVMYETDGVLPSQYGSLKPFNQIDRSKLAYISQEFYEELSYCQSFNELQVDIRKYDYLGKNNIGQDVFESRDFRTYYRQVPGFNSPQKDLLVPMGIREKFISSDSFDNAIKQNIYNKTSSEVYALVRQAKFQEAVTIGNKIGFFTRYPDYLMYINNCHRECIRYQLPNTTSSPETEKILNDLSQYYSLDPKVGYLVHTLNNQHPAYPYFFDEKGICRLIKYDSTLLNDAVIPKNIGSTSFTQQRDLLNAFALISDKSPHKEVISSAINDIAQSLKHDASVSSNYLKRPREIHTACTNPNADQLALKAQYLSTPDIQAQATTPFGQLTTLQTKTTIFNQKLELSEHSQRILKEIGLENALSIDKNVRLTKKQESLIACNTDLINKSADLFDRTQDPDTKEVMVDNIKLTVVAHDVIVNNHIDRATNIMNFCYRVYHAYEICEKILLDSFKERIKEIIHDPKTFAKEQASGIYHASIAAAKMLYRFDRLHREIPIKIRRDEDGLHFELNENLQVMMDFSNGIAQKAHQFIRMTPEQRGDTVKKILKTSGRIGADTVVSWPLFTATSKICKPITQVVKTKLSPEQLQRLEYFERSANTIDMVFDETAQAWVVKETIAAELIPIAASTELAELAPLAARVIQEGPELANAAKATAAASSVTKNATDLVEKQRELVQVLDKVKDQKIVTDAIAQSPCKELFTKYEPLVNTAQKYGISNAEEALQVLKINEHRLEKYHEPFALIDNVAKDLQKINSNPRWATFKIEADGTSQIKNIIEAKAAIACEEQGLLSNLKRGTNMQEDFIDSFGQLWDVKTAHSLSPLTAKKIFDAKDFVSSLQEKITPHENIILEITYLNEKDIGNLYAELVKLPRTTLDKMMIIHAENPQLSISIDKTASYIEGTSKDVI